MAALNMSHSHGNRSWLKSSVWQLSTLALCAVAVGTGTRDGSGIFDLTHRFSTSRHTLTFEAEPQPPELCPKPEPCYQNADTEFCVFTANTNDEMGRSQAVPIVAEPKRASEILRIVSDADHTRHNQSSPRYTVSPIPGKGLGVISNGELKQGDLILSDSPSLIVDHCMMAAVPQHHLARLMNEAASRLSGVQRGRILDLAVFGDGAPDEHYLVGRIYATSAYMLDSDVALFGDGCGVGALFPEVSRMNHDCRPNAAYHFDPDMAAMAVHAVRPIAAGEEITVSYISPFLVRGHRQHLLHSRWGFKCSCTACSAPASAVNTSDSRLEKIASLWPQLLGERSDELPAPVRGVKATELADLLVSLSEAERLDAVMLQPYRVAALEWNAIGDHDKAVRYARLAAQYGRNSFGSWSQMVRGMQELIQAPDAHWSWRLRS